jgi:hypothetical protein
MPPLAGALISIAGSGGRYRDGLLTLQPTTSGASYELRHAWLYGVHTRHASRSGDQGARVRLGSPVRLQVRISAMRKMDLSN